MIWNQVPHRIHNDCVALVESQSLNAPNSLRPEITELLFICIGSERVLRQGTPLQMESQIGTTEMKILTVVVMIMKVIIL